MAALRGDGSICSSVLHRLCLKSYGKPVWEYDSELALLKGFRAALKGVSIVQTSFTTWFADTFTGHQFLYEQGILHRDVSAGNILLSSEQNPREGYEGFIMYVEFAHIFADHISTDTDVESAKSGLQQVKHGVIMIASI